MVQGDKAWPGGVRAAGDRGLHTFGHLLPLLESHLLGTNGMKTSSRPGDLREHKASHHPDFHPVCANPSHTSGVHQSEVDGPALLGEWLVARH